MELALTIIGYIALVVLGVFVGLGAFFYGLFKSRTKGK